jgi:DNA polymerase III delta subunit
MRSFVPPIHFRREPLVKAALSAWSEPRLAQVMKQLAETAFNVRRMPKLSEALAQRALLMIAQQGRRRAG